MILEQHKMIGEKIESYLTFRGSCHGRSSVAGVSGVQSQLNGLVSEIRLCSVVHLACIACMSCQSVVLQLVVLTLQSCRGCCVYMERGVVASLKAALCVVRRQRCVL